MDRVPGKTRSSDLYRIFTIVVAWILALNLLVFSFYMFFYHGSYYYIGDYDGYSLYRFHPYEGLVIPSLLLLALSVTLYMAIPYISRRSTIILLTVTIFLLVAYIFIVFDYSQSIKAVLLFYGGKTDSYVLQYAAAKAILNGENPYTMNFSSVLKESIDSGVLPISKVTYVYEPSTTRYAGSEIIGFVDRFDYPAMAALYYIPAILLGISGVYWDAIIIGLALGIVYLKADTPIRHLILALFASGAFSFFGIMYLGSPHAGWVAPLMVAMAYSSNPIVSGIMLGLSSSYRETAVIFSAFFAVYVLRKYGWHRFTRFSASYVVTGLIVNLPFFLLDPHAFIHNIMLPASYNLYPEGFGLSSLHYIGVSIDKRLSMILFVASFMVLLIISYVYFSKIETILFTFPSLVFLFYYRPMTVYYEYFFVINAMYLVLSSRPEHPEINVKLLRYSRWLAYTVVAASILSVFSVYMGSPRDIQRYITTIPKPLIYSVVFAGAYIFTLFIAYSFSARRIPIRSFKLDRMRGAKIIISILIFSLFVAFLGQYLFPTVRILVYTPYYVDTDSAVTGLSGARILDFKNPYHVDYSGNLIELLKEGKIGAFFGFYNYTRNYPIAPHAELYLYGRITYTGSNWVPVSWKTGIVLIDPLLSFIVNDSNTLRGLSYFLLFLGQVLFLRALISLASDETEKLIIMTVYSSIFIPVLLFPYTSPLFAIEAGLLLLIGSIILRSRLSQLSAFLVGVGSVISTFNLAGLAALLLSTERSDKRTLSYIGFGFLSMIIASIVLGGESVFAVFGSIIDKGVSASHILLPIGLLGPIIVPLKLLTLLMSLLVGMILCASRSRIIYGCMFIAFTTLIITLPLWRFDHLTFILSLYVVVTSIRRMIE